MGRGAGGRIWEIWTRKEEGDSQTRDYSDTLTHIPRSSRVEYIGKGDGKKEKKYGNRNGNGNGNGNGNAGGANQSNS